MSDEVRAITFSALDYSSLPWMGELDESGDSVQIARLDPDDPHHAAIIAEQNARYPAGQKTGGIRVLIRNPREWQPDATFGKLLAFTDEEWNAFRSGAKDGEFDLVDASLSEESQGA